MNVDTLNSKFKVVSRYFATKTVMDESLSDFKEKKSFKVKNNKAPAKPKAKKVKQVKGQKDIRTVLKAKKNELVAYSEDFDSICRKSGVDVDSEQLQLAIALSRSLQTPDSADCPSSSSKTLTTQQRTGLIRTTLKEYGFKVPEKPTTSRKTKRRRKPYKLLLTSEEEKRQIISDRYSQILFQLNNLKSTTIDTNLVLTNNFIYNMATNIKYENIKDDDIFYIENVVEKSSNNMGCLLKNWSEIPGRPSSPDQNKSELLFSEVECSQEELDVVLSGRLECSKDILRKKNMLLVKETSLVFCKNPRNVNEELIELSPDSDEDNADNHSSPVFITSSSSNNIQDTYNCNESLTEVKNKEEKNLLVITQPSRSLSPDLFDDEDEIAVDIAVETMTDIDTKAVNNVTTQVSEIMDLTKCVNIIVNNNFSNISSNKPLSQLSQPSDVTKRKSNDFMEMTNCVGGSSQHNLDRIDEEIDLNGQCDNLDTTEKGHFVENDKILPLSDQPLLKEVDDHVDLTVECENKTDMNKYGSIKDLTNAGHLLEDDTKEQEHIDLTGHNEKNIETNYNSLNAENIEHMDLTQSSNSSNDTLPFVHIGGTQVAPEKSLDETIILNENDYMEEESSQVKQVLNDSDHQKQNTIILNENDYMEEESSQVKQVLNDSDHQKQNQDIITAINQANEIDLISPKHVSVENDEGSIINLDETCEKPNDNVDLTQTSDSNDADKSICNNSPLYNNSSLGKKDDVSVDYDEALENMNSFPYYDNEIYDNDTIVRDEQSENSNDKVIFLNSKEAVLEVSNNKVNSPLKNHFDFGGISVIDNLSSFNSKSRCTINSIPNGSMRDSLPMVNVKGSFPDPKSPLTDLDSVSNKNIDQKRNDVLIQTPRSKGLRHINVETPEQSEYIVKTDNVTPMLDFASMSTPERNKELDKYGLKPFKRKRAIQLLTHLYNQTHPYVESVEELPSPSKKRRTEHCSQPSTEPSSSTSQGKTSKSPRKTSRSPRKASKSPRKASKSPRKTSRSPKGMDDGHNNDSDKENGLFIVTREVPVIRNVECDPDDWVFQKREKAKLHTCRVPLHIAFHNYVSCRSRLHEAILRYEPVNIDVIHKDLAASGHRYDPKDLLKFLDKKCITVKTADNTKNNKRY